MNRRRVREDWWAQADIDRAQIFVPAIMGAGLLVSAVTLLRDALHGRRRTGRDRRTALQSAAVASFVRGGGAPDQALAAGLRPRFHYLLLALSAGGLAFYGAFGATKNYTAPAYRFGSHDAWIYAFLLAGVAALAAVAAVAVTVLVSWPATPRSLRPLLARTPLGQRPGSGRPAVLLLGWGALIAAAAAAQFTFTTAGAPQLLAEFDDESRPLAEAGSALFWDLLGTVPVALGAAVVLGLLTRTCAAFALGQLGVVAAALAGHTLFTDVVERVHPPDGPLAGLTDSLPSAPVLQATLLAGFVPLGVYTVTGRRRPALLTLALTGALLAATAVGLVVDRLAWPSDVVAGLLVGTALVLGTWWALERRGWHDRCGRCAWRSEDAAPTERLVPLTPARERAVRRGSLGLLAASVVVLLGLALVEGLPVSPEGETLGADNARTIQLGLLGLVVVGGLVSVRWALPGAVLLALAGTTLGIFAALTYQPWVSVLVAAAFLLPAAGIWLVWQHTRTMRAVTTLALVTAVALGGTFTASGAVYDQLYGPAHRMSGLVLPPVEQVVWAWSGGVTTDSARVVAELAAEADTVRLVVEDDDGAVVRSDATAPDPFGIVRLSVDGLEPGTTYTWTVEVDGTPDLSRGTGVFTTVPDRPASFTLAFGACARTGSSGAVFDAIREVDPLLFVHLGDLHYGNIARDDVTRFAARYRDVLTSPAQSALYRSVATAYIWGDHDYGANDADSTSPSRDAARTAYRRHVPSHDLAEGRGGAVYQAFDVGRVRLILTDNRSERTENSMLGQRQLAWLQRELVRSARDSALVIWVNPDPWVAPAGAGRDDWGGYAHERQQIADTIADAAIDNLVMVSGDAHMVAIDDGTNTDYSSSGGGAFPLLHAAALDRPGSVKGGPFSEGAFPGGGQFGTVTVTDDGGGGEVGVRLAGLDWRGDELVELTTTVSAPGA
jgi:membrane-associated phospholipid phosphatase